MTYEFTDAANGALAKALDLARATGAVHLNPVHLAVALFDETSESGRTGVAMCNKISGVELKDVQRRLQDQLRSVATQHPPPNSVGPNRGLATVLREADKLRADQKDSHVAVDHLLVALMGARQVATTLNQAGLGKDKIKAAVKTLRGAARVSGRGAESNFDALEKYGTDLTALAEEGKLDPVIGRDEEIRRVIQILSRRRKNNPCLVGEPGTGKTAIMEGVAQRIVNRDIPTSLEDCRVFSLDVGALIAGASHRGEFEDRLKTVLKEVSASEGRTLLAIDEMHLLLGAGQTSGAMDAANLLKPMLARGELRCIGATTLAEYRKYVEKDAAFERRFQMVAVREPSVEDTISILRGIKDAYQAHHGVRITDAALVGAARLSDRYITHRFLPDKAIDLVDEACASTRVQLDSQPEEIDQLQRRKNHLQVEEHALAQETDRASKERLCKVREELGALREQLNPLLLRYQAERKQVDELRQYQEKLDALRAKLARAQREHNLALAADLQYGAIPDTERKLEALTKQSEEGKAANTDRLLSEVVAEDKIAEVVARWTGIPVARLTQTAAEKLLQLPELLHQRVVGQHEAVEVVSQAILRSRAGLASQQQPTGSFLFLGPTGVGKTELAKALAHQLFDTEKNIVRVDMSEYMEAHSVSRLIGAPPGYVGHEEGGFLTEKIRRNPYSVVLFDEVEKAHRQVFNALLQVLDDGRLTDGKGVTVDFTNTIIVMTSNLGAEHLLTHAEATAAETKTMTNAEVKAVRDRVMGEVRQFFRPEFLNRLSDIVFFHPLSRDQLGQIVQLQLAQLSDRLRERDVSVALTPRATQLVLHQAYDPAFGARPLRRHLERHIITHLSRMILEGNLPNHSQVQVDVDATGSGLTYRVAASPSASRTHMPAAKRMRTKPSTADPSDDGAMLQDASV